MIENITSTKEEPIKVFKWLIEERNFEFCRNSFFQSFQNHEDVIYEDGDTVSYIATFPDNNDNPVDATIKIHFSDEFNRKLKYELDIAIENIDAFIPSLRVSNGNVEGYLNGLLKELLHIKENHSISLRKHTCFESIVILLIQDIQVKLDIEKKELPIIGSLPTDPVEDIVIEIFSFLNGVNENGQRIMSQSDYDRMILAIREMLKYELAPKLTPRISKLNITNELLKFAFYILHKKLYGIKPQRKYFIDFLKNNFKQFDDTTEKVLKSRFSIQPKYFDKSTPSIIKDEKKMP